MVATPKQRWRRWGSWGARWVMGGMAVGCLGLVFLDAAGWAGVHWRGHGGLVLRNWAVWFDNDWMGRARISISHDTVLVERRASLGPDVMVEWCEFPRRPGVGEALGAVRWMPGYWRHQFVGGVADVRAVVPVWIPTLACAGGCAVAWRRRLRPRRAGVCAGCGYDLAGLGVGAACPECGSVR